MSPIVSRSVTLLILLMFLLGSAGCIEGPEGSGDGDQDPGSDGDDGNGPVSGRDPSSPGGPTVHQEAEDEDPQRGLRLLANLTSEDGTHRIHAEGRNEGPDDHRLETGCQSSWKLDYEDGDGRSFEPREALGGCQGFELEPFAAETSVERTFWWNETWWNEDAGQVEAVPPGRYVWTVSFVVWGQDDEDQVRLQAAFEITVQ